MRQKQLMVIILLSVLMPVLAQATNGVRVESGGEEVGVRVEGQGNWLVRNQARQEGVINGVDAHGDCLHNRWIGNDFLTADPPCILELPPRRGADVASDGPPPTPDPLP
jgi:hypothetical protein